MRKITQKEYETIQEIFELTVVKVLFSNLFKEELITRIEYEALIKKCDEKIREVLVKGGLVWKNKK